MKSFIHRYIPTDRDCLSHSETHQPLPAVRVNDYIATLYNIALGYGRASGGKNTYGDKTPGSRIIVLKEGKREFDTWLREKGNMAKLNVCTYPGSFVKEK